MRTNEHIVLQSDPQHSHQREVPQLQTARTVHTRLQLRSALRRHIVELSLVDYYFLGVRSRQARRGESEYVLDLRHIDPALRLERHVAWRWMAATLGLASLAAAGAWHIGSSPISWWQHGWLPASATLLGLSVCTGFLFIYFTTETLGVYSAHGQTRLLQFTGGPGTLRQVRPFTVRLAAHLRMVNTHKPARAEQLREEMREHCRLKEQGVLPAKEYEAGKTRILSQFDQPAPPCR